MGKETDLQLLRFSRRRAQAALLRNGLCCEAFPHIRYEPQKGQVCHAPLFGSLRLSGKLLLPKPSRRSVARGAIPALNFARVKSLSGGRFRLLHEGSGSVPRPTAAFVQQAELPTQATKPVLAERLQGPPSLKSRRDRGQRRNACQSGPAGVSGANNRRAYGIDLLRAIPTNPRCTLYLPASWIGSVSLQCQT